MRISVIVPALNEAAGIGSTLAAVRELRPHEILVADGGSTDATVRIAREFATVIHAPAGRGSQQRAAAQAATGEVLWFLHADCVPDPGALDAIRDCLSDPRAAGGNFTVRFDGATQAARRLTRIYPHLRRFGLLYGDSGIFVRRSVYDAAGGFQPIPLFEDIDLVRRVRKAGRFPTLLHGVTASSRRFEHRHFGAMFTHWMTLQVLFWAGVSPYRLADYYSPVRKRR